MSSEVIFIIIISIVVISFVFEQLLDFLNIRSQRTDIPQEMSGWYDADRYSKSLRYHRELTSFGFLTSGFGFVLSLFMLFTGGFGWVEARLAPMISSPEIRSVAFFGLLMLASDILTLPFQLYSTFVIEEKYGFNRTTLKTFFIDKIKGYLLAALIGGPLLAALVFLVLKIGPQFWIWFSLIATAFVLLMNLFYTSWILPLFNKLSPLQDGELKNAIIAFSRKVDFPLDNIFVIDGSKRSSKANAFFSGIGKKKKIVLYDTLIEKHSTDELIAVLAHEVGHFKKKHIIFSLVLSVVQIFFTMFILSQIIYSEQVSMALGGAELSIPLNLIAFSILFSPVSGLTGLFMMMYSRRNEFEADAYARETYNSSALSDALKRLSVDTLSNLHPHPLYVFFHYSHPPLLERLRALRRD